MSIFNMAGVDEAQVGDLKDSLGVLSSKWLACNGAGVNSSSYPKLVPMLQQKNPTYRTLPIPKTYYDSNTDINMQGACYNNGRWVLVAVGYKNSKNCNKPVIYTTTDLYGEWKEVLLASSGFFMRGVVYDAKWGEYIAYGYKVVSDEESYPYIFHTADPAGTWSGYQVSSTKCVVAAGCYANGKLVLLAKGPTTWGSDAYAFVCPGYSISFSEYHYSDSHSQGIRNLVYGNGYWAYADNGGGFFYTDDPAGTWTRKELVSAGVQFRGITYVNGTWVLSGMQNSGGSGRAYYATDITGDWTSNGVTDPNNYNEFTWYDGGVWIMTTNNMGGGSCYYVSTDNARNWTKKQQSIGPPYGLAAQNGQFVICTLYGASVLRRPQYDAPLPILTPKLGTTYIKAL